MLPNDCDNRVEGFDYPFQSRPAPRFRFIALFVDWDRSDVNVARAVIADAPSDRLFERITTCRAVDRERVVLVREVPKSSRRMNGPKICNFTFAFVDLSFGVEQPPLGIIFVLPGIKPQTEVRASNARPLSDGFSFAVSQTSAFRIDFAKE